MKKQTLHSSFEFAVTTTICKCSSQSNWQYKAHLVFCCIIEEDKTKEGWIYLYTEVDMRKGKSTAIKPYPVEIMLVPS